MTPGGCVDGPLPRHGLHCDDPDAESNRAFSEGCGSSTARMKELFDFRDLRHRSDGGKRTCRRLAGDEMTSQFLPGLLLTAGPDAPQDDTTAPRDRLRCVDVPDALHVHPRVVHGFINCGRLPPSAGIWLTRSATFKAGLDTR